MRTSARLAAPLAAAALAALPVLPAAAHDELVSSTPEAGSVLPSAPGQVELTYSAEMTDIGSQVLVTDSGGNPVTDGPVQQDGARVVQPLADTGAGDETYRVVWRVVSSDGHPIEGQFSYDVGDGADPGATAAPAGGTGEPATGGTSAQEQPVDATGVPRWLVAVGGAAAALAVLAAVAVRRARG